MDQFNEQHIRRFYRLLAHGTDFSDMRCINVNGGGVVDRSIVQGEEAVVSWAKRFNGKGNLFTGRNPRTGTGTVSRITTASLDLDAVREKGTAATEAAVQRVIVGARRIVSAFGCGDVGMSGNGCLVILSGFNTPVAECKDFESKLVAVENRARALLSDAKGEIICDHTHDSARMVKLLGSLSCKGNQKDWRLSRFLDLSNNPRSTQSLFSEAPRVAAPSLPSSKDLVKKTIYASRSEADFALAFHYKQAGLGPEDTLAALQAHVIGRQTDTADQKRILDKVFSGAGPDDTPSNVGEPLAVVVADGGFLREHRERLFTAPAGAEFPTGFRLLDEHVRLRRGEISTIAARPGVGKTSIAIKIASELCKQGKRVLFCTTEMSADAILSRFVSILSGVSTASNLHGQYTNDQRDRLTEAYSKLESFGSNLQLCDKTSPRLSQIRSYAESTRPSLIIFDHIQHVGGSTGDARVDVSAFVRGLKDVARDFNCPVLALSQLRRLGKDKNGKEPEPSMSDLKESGTIEEESAHVVLLSLLTGEDKDEKAAVLAHVAKNRYGPLMRIGLEFHRPTVTFRDLETDTQQCEL